MKVLVACPEGHEFRCEQQHLGRSVRCPKAGCNRKFVLTPLLKSVPTCSSCGMALHSSIAVICTTCGTDQRTGKRHDTEVDSASDNPAGPSYNELLYANRVRDLSKDTSSEPVNPFLAFLFAAGFTIIAFVPIEPLKPMIVPDAFWSVVVAAWAPVCLFVAFFTFMGGLAELLPEPKKHQNVRPSLADRLQSLGDKSSAASSNSVADGSGPTLQAVMTELDRLNNPKGSMVRSMTVLGVSAVAFVAFGLRFLDASSLLLLVAILLIHESGHFATMRWFGYRNVRMFFIPLFGAAVAGRKARTKGWEEAVVALAGPLPGLFMGYVLGLLYLADPSTWLGISALLFILVNGFNLLPAFPLDGGRVLNSLVFCRNRHLEAAFRALAGLLLLGLGLLLGSWLLIIFAVLTLLAVWHVVRINAIVVDVRANDPSRQYGNDEMPSADEANVIIATVHTHMPDVTTAAGLASTVDSVWQRLNIRPERPLVAIGLLTVYGVSLASVFLFLVLMLAMMIGGTVPTPESGPIAEFVAGFQEGYRDAVESSRQDIAP